MLTYLVPVFCKITEFCVAKCICILHSFEDCLLTVFWFQINRNIQWLMFFFLFLFLFLSLLCQLQYLDRPGVTFCHRTTYDDNAITNAVEIYDSPRCAVVFQSLLCPSFECVEANLTCTFYSVVLFTLWLQIMIALLEISIWRGSSFPSNSALIGLWM